MNVLDWYDHLAQCLEAQALLPCLPFVCAGPYLVVALGPPRALLEDLTHVLRCLQQSDRVIRL